MEEIARLFKELALLFSDDTYTPEERLERSADTFDAIAREISDLVERLEQCEEELGL